jgi:formylglycine-generating enzyme required for sulfatase activity
MQIRGVIYALLVGIIFGLVGWMNQSFFEQQWLWYAKDRPFVAANIWPFVLKPAAEHTLVPGKSFRDCSARDGKDYCPKMIVVPAGSFVMGSLPPQSAREDQACRMLNVRAVQATPRHRVVIGRPFSVSAYEVTFNEWDTCVNYGSCPADAAHAPFGRGNQPVIEVNWFDAQAYVDWLSKVTGKRYRLLSEAEYEYATRAGTETLYPWGNDIPRKPMANCYQCSKPDNAQTTPVNSFPKNHFGLYDMVGNVLEWVQDCYHDGYADAPTDGSAWVRKAAHGMPNAALCDDNDRRIDRSASWNNPPNCLSSSHRDTSTPNRRGTDLGFRVARDLDR